MNHAKSPASRTRNPAAAASRVAPAERPPRTLEEWIRRGRGGLIGAIIELTKPGITSFVTVTALCGHLVAWLSGSASPFPLSPLFHLLLGVTSATAGALALNQYLERGSDALMHRTRPRPLPSGRIAPLAALILGAILVAGGFGHLWFWIGPVPAFLTALSALLYNGVYTPLKLRSPLATPVGAIPGALPALIGWSAHTGTIDGRGLALFGILFAWQFIHVLALGWNLRDDYRRAGFRLIPPGSAAVIAGFMVVHAVALLALSTLPALLGMAGGLYLPGALALGVGMIVLTLAFLLKPTRQRCNRIFLGSLIYHPLLLGLMVIGAL